MKKLLRFIKECHGFGFFCWPGREGLDRQTEGTDGGGSV